MGGGGPSIPQRKPSQEFNTIFNKAWPQQYQNYTNFWQNEPLLSGANTLALQDLQNLPQLTGPLQTLLGQIPGQFANYQQQLRGYQAQLPGYQQQLSGYQNQLGQDLGRLQGVYRGLTPVSQLTTPLQNLIGSQRQDYAAINPVVQSLGALTPEQQRQVDTSTAALAAQAGMANTQQNLGSTLLNRDVYRQQRYQQALNSALGLSGSIGGLTGEIGGLRAQDVASRQGLLQAMAGVTGQGAGLTQARAGLTQLGAGLTGQQAGLTGQQAGLTSGLASGIQGLQGGALNQLLGTEQAKTGNYATLMNPIFNYMSDLFSSNQNAAATQSIAGSNKSSGLLGGSMSSIGSVLGAILPIVMSDARIKTNIRDTGQKTPEGIPIKTFNYKGPKFRGVVAQDVEKVRPDAVVTHPATGRKFVAMDALMGTAGMPQMMPERMPRGLIEPARKVPSPRGPRVPRPPMPQMMPKLQGRMV